MATMHSLASRIRSSLFVIVAFAVAAIVGHTQVTTARPGNCYQNYLDECCSHLSEVIPCDAACSDCCGRLAPGPGLGDDTWALRSGLSSGYTLNSFTNWTMPCCRYYAAHCEGSTCHHDSTTSNLNAHWHELQYPTTACP